MKTSVNIIGAGLAGLSAAITLARNEIPSRLISLLPSERAQSVLAEGGINGALNTMGEDDKPLYHYEDTLKAGVYIADPLAVKGLTDTAPEILKELSALGVPFQLQQERIVQRNFGGQKKKRTAYAKSSTGKVLMTALIDEARKYEAAGWITRYSHHELADLFVRPSDDGGGFCEGALIRDTYQNLFYSVQGPVILAFGGMNGLFPGKTTGTVTNSGDAAALAFRRGVVFSSLEMIQYHPTTVGIAGKRCLVSEAARGEGGRLFVMRDGNPWYFMEEKYPELGNLMPRDVVSREMYFVSHALSETDENRLQDSGERKPAQIWLDMRHLSSETWNRKLPDLRCEVMHYLGIDPAKQPVPVEPGIHYFMGGIDVDIFHRTNYEGLYAAGECCSQYHGANRLGGNSTMGAIYGGRMAALSLVKIWQSEGESLRKTESKPEEGLLQKEPSDAFRPGSDRLAQEVSGILLKALGIVRNEQDLRSAQRQIEALLVQSRSDQSSFCAADQNRLLLAEAVLKSADLRKESRGAHYRSDCPGTDDHYQGKTVCRTDPVTGGLQVGFMPLSEYASHSEQASECGRRPVRINRQSKPAE